MERLGYDSFSNESWTLKLVEYTKEVLMDGRVRAIGVCYGHQIIGRALGVPVGRSTSGWEVSVVAINLTELGKSVLRQDTLV
jgi:GMP synthase-like glutamine amidotransferase